jgi:methionyl aminopeptidase
MSRMERDQGLAGADSRRIVLHPPEDFEGMRRAGRLASATLDMIAPHVVPGVTTAALDRLCHDFIAAHGAVPAPLGYRGFPKSICTSVNHVVCHGIPGERALEEGDIVNIDVTVILDGWHGDTSRMFAAGTPSRAARLLMDVTYEAMWRGIRAIRPGATLGDLGFAIQSYVERQRFSVVRDFCGHGLGRSFHEAPNVLHFGRPGEGVTLREGMFFTVEPMVNAGRPEVKILDDGWTAVTRDRRLSAQYEHCIGVTATGCEVFTLSEAERRDPRYSAFGA